MQIYCQADDFIEHSDFYVSIKIQTINFWVVKILKCMY